MGVLIESFEPEHMRSLFLPILIILLALSHPFTVFSQTEEEVGLRGEEQTEQTQKKDSITPVPRVPFFYEKDLENPFLASQRIVDTTLYMFQRYDYNMARYPFFTHRGNTGLSSRSLWFNPWIPSPENLMPYAHLDYALGHAPVEFFRPLSPFSELYYVSGAEKEQLFYARHAQRIHKNFHLGLKYMIVNSPGEYSRNASINNGLLFTGDYLSDNKKYQALATVYTNKLLNHENGGLSNPEDFIQDPNTEQVKYRSAESRYRDLGVRIKQYYLTGFYLQAEDSLTPRRFVNLGKFSHTFDISRKANIFENRDKPIKIPDMNLRDPISTLDSIRVYYLENTIAYAYTPLKTSKRRFPLTFSAFLSHRRYDVEFDGRLVMRDDTLRPTRNNFGINRFVQGGHIATDTELPLSFRGYGELSKGGYFDNDYILEGGLMLGKASSDKRLEFDLKLSGEKVPYYASRYFANTFSWNNTFDQTTTVAFRSQGIFKKQKAGLSYYLINKPIYFDTLARPVQNQGIVNIISPWIENHLNLKFFEINSLLVYQFVSDNNFERYPEILGHVNVLFNIRLFKGSLNAQAGVDIIYNSPYKPMSFEPMSRIFHLQDDYSTPEHLYVDPFITAKIKRTRFFVKFQDVLAFLPNYKTFYTVPYYAMPGPAFKFGVSWMFFD